MKYITIQGETWSDISYKITGSEYNMGDIMKANKQYLGTIIFKAGCELYIPDNIKNKEKIISNPWG